MVPMLLRLHSISRSCYLHGIPVIPRFIEAVTRVLFKCLLPPECSIGPGTRLHHHGWAIGIDPDVKIGRECNIYNLVFRLGGVEGAEDDAVDRPSGPDHHLRSREQSRWRKSALQGGHPHYWRRKHNRRQCDGRIRRSRLFARDRRTGADHTE